MNEYAVAALGEDRPGIVADVSEALLGAGVSIEDSAMTILGGHFAMLLLVGGDLDAEGLEQALAPVAEKLDLLLEVRATSARASVGAGTEHVISAYGPDRPGLVASLARVLARESLNITAFGSRLTEGGVFAMWFNVVLPPSVDTDALVASLAAAGGEVSLDVSVHEAASEEL